MKLRAKIIKGSTIIKEEESSFSGQGKFQQQLEQCFVVLCKRMDISVPMWLRKNTREFVRYKRTSFQSDQFIEPVGFDRFEIRLFEE